MNMIWGQNPFFVEDMPRLTVSPISFFAGLRCNV